MTAVLTEGDVSRHAECDGLWQRRGLGEEVQVVEGKDKLDGFIHLNGDLETGDKRESSNTHFKLLVMSNLDPTTIKWIKNRFA